MYDEEIQEVIAKGGGKVDALVIHHVLTALKAPESNRWLRCSIFHTACTSSGKQCKVIIDSGSMKI